MYPKKKVVFGAAAAAVLLMPTTAMANTSLRTSITGELRYDSNPLAMRDPRSDFIASLSPEFEVADEGRRLTLKGLYRPAGRYYFRDPDNSTISHYATAGLRYGISERSALTLDNSLTYSRESREAVPGGIETGRDGILSNTLSAGLTRDLGERSDLGLDASSSIQAYDNPSSVDSRTEAFGAAFTHRVSRLYSLSASYWFRNHNFESQTGRSSTAGHSIGLAAKGELTPTVKIEASGGVFFAPDKDDEYEWEAGTSFTKSFRTSVLSLGYTRQVTTSSGLTDELNISQNLSASWAWSFSRAAEALFFGSLGRNRTIQGEAVDIDTMSAGLTLSWSLSQYFALGAGYTRFEQDSSGSVGTGLTRNVVLLSFTATPYSRRL